MTLTPANVPAIASGVLSFTLTGSGGSAVEPPNTPAAYKTFANITSGLIATAKITTTATGNAGCILSVATNNTFASAASNAFVGTFGNTAGSWGSDPIAGFPTDLVGTTGDYFCLAVATNGSVTVGQATTAATCSPTTTATGVTIPTTGSAIIALTGLSGTATPETCTFDEFTVTNAAATAGVTATAPLYEY